MTLACRANPFYTNPDPCQSEDVSIIFLLDTMRTLSRFFYISAEIEQ
jgi:hypothetical protein